MARPIDRKSSIDAEPRTLSFEQLQLARKYWVAGRSVVCDAH